MHKLTAQESGVPETKKNKISITAQLCDDIRFHFLLEVNQ